MEMQQKEWNEKFQLFRAAVEDKNPNMAQVNDLFGQVHGAVHTCQVSGGQGWWFYEDEVWEGLTEEGFRFIPANGEHSIAWALWHITRIEDITMNWLTAGQAQIFTREDWFERLKVPFKDTGNEMQPDQIALLSRTLDMAEFRAYRQKVGMRTREVVRGLTAEDLKQKVDPVRCEQVMQEGMLIPAAVGIMEYWRGKTIGGLLLMPPTRHNYVHMNECQTLKEAWVKSTKRKNR